MDGKRKGAYGYDEIAHTADWALKVWAPDLLSLFITAARGMYSLLGVVQKPGERVNRKISIESQDMEGLLVEFLSELLYFCDDGIAFDKFDLAIRPEYIGGSLAGGRIAAIHKEIKAVTYHDLVIRQTGDRFEVTLVFDV